MTLEELVTIEISSVSKKAEPLSDAAAAVYVITQQDIRRYGATSIPEILRLAPNLQVARLDSNRYAITARGFNSTSSNKLLVLIDGRSVYTPLFSGVFWDVQDVFLEDIERIEVISGPGGTLWGSNAVNGVINIITRHTRNTTGGLLNIDAGTEELGAGVRYGGKISDEATYRIYAKGFDRENTVTASGTGVKDSWRKGQLGFRMDWGRASDALMLQGDLYGGSIDQPVNDDRKISGGNVLARWNRTLQGGSALQVQAYFDKTRRIFPGSFGEVLDTYDIEAQHRFKWGAQHEIVWGGGYRWSEDDVTNSAALAFLPTSRSLSLANIFLQDSIPLTERLELTVGVKLEHNTYTGLEVQPSGRLGWKLRDNALLWAAVSRAVRTPSRLDRDLFVPGSAPFQIAGGPDFTSETLIAYEIGYRMEPVPEASFSISMFYNVYDELRSIEAAAGGGPPSVFDNKMEGETYGVEVWGSYRVRNWWKLSAGFNYLQEDLRFKPDSRDTFGVQAAGNDPTYQLSLRSTMTPVDYLEVDLALRSIDRLPNPDVPGYVALDGRIGWKVSKLVELSLIGFNLLDRRHPEFGAAPGRSEQERSVYLKMRWSF
ncbi:MAG: TonB-dependent receptor plug domain-containing protein [Candidatus Entotheonellia bacterium]